MGLIFALILANIYPERVEIRASASGCVLSSVSASKIEWQRKETHSQKREITVKEVDGTTTVLRLQEFY